MARKVNRVCGFGAVTPMDVGQLDEEWSALFDGLYEIEKASDERGMMNDENKRNFEAVLARRRAQNSGYRKY